MNEGRDYELFAMSILSLTLIRNGYAIQKEKKLGGGLRADIVAEKINDDGLNDTFAVEIGWTAEDPVFATDLEDKRERLSASFGLPVYFAYVIGDGSKMYADYELVNKMLYSADEVEVIEIPSAPFYLRPRG